MFSGTKGSLKEVYEMVGGMSNLTNNTLQLTSVKTSAVNGDNVAALVTWKAAKPAGEQLDVDNIDVCTVKNEKIVKAIVYGR